MYTTFIMQDVEKKDWISEHNSELQTLANNAAVRSWWFFNKFTDHDYKDIADLAEFILERIESTVKYFFEEEKFTIISCGYITVNVSKEDEGIDITVCLDLAEGGFFGV